MESYRQSANEFSNWMKANYPEVKDINNVQKGYAIAYLQHRQNDDKSAWTISKDMSALNKVFNLNVSKQEAGLRERSYKNTERSRSERNHDHKYNAKNYDRQITFTQAFGCRRESILAGHYQVKEVSLFKQEGKVYVSLIEKGGRYREAPCLSSMQPTIEKMFPKIEYRDSLTKQQFQELYATSKGHLFDRYTTKIDNHAFRHEYARDLYQELMDRREPGQKEELYRGYNKEILKGVSEALGHSRLSVVVEHYLR
jgi:hypothetical protein